MPYRKLYTKRQDANGAYQPRSWYVDDAKNLSWVSGIEIDATDAMPIEGLSGFIVRYKPENAGLRHRYQVIVAEGLDATPFMERFVVIKEIMHCYFACDDGSATDSQIVLDTHMRQFFGKSATTQSLHVQAEYRAFWMAMGVMCPERLRVEARARTQSGEWSITQVSEMIRTPEHIVSQMLSDQFEDELRDILN